MEELATELDETKEYFGKYIIYHKTPFYQLNTCYDISVNMVGRWDAWSRPDPELPSKLRQENKAETDPNFEANLNKMFLKGRGERTDYDLPSTLRLLKYKNMASVQKLAAKDLRANNNAELAAEVSFTLVYLTYAYTILIHML